MSKSILNRSINNNNRSLLPEDELDLEDVYTATQKPARGGWKVNKESDDRGALPLPSQPKVIVFSSDTKGAVDMHEAWTEERQVEQSIKAALDLKARLREIAASNAAAKHNR